MSGFLTCVSDNNDFYFHTLILGPGILALGQTPPFIVRWFNSTLTIYHFSIL